MSADTLATAQPAVELEGITKRFPGVVANHDIRITVQPGTVHAIVGENGAGKSTLMKILYGMQRPDEGTIKVNGTPVSFRTPSDAIEAGIGMVHQHFMLADNFTVLENIVLGAEPKRFGKLDRAGARERITGLAETHGLRVDPDKLVENLGVGERQRVEILKVLYRGARILILDEPTAVLVPQEVEELFQNLRELKDEGLTVIFISHKLDEVLGIADAITVIRRGTTVASVDPREVTARQLAELMVGSELPTPETRESTVTDTVALTVAGLTMEADGHRRVPKGTSVSQYVDKLRADGVRLLLDDVSFEIRKGEILGIAGVEGNGQSELIEAIMGIRPTHGAVTLNGRDISAWSTLQRRESGIGYIPEDRHRQGLLLEAPLWENRVLGHQTRKLVPGKADKSRGLWVDRKAAKADTERIIRDYDVRTPGVDTLALALSGGNQQKLIVGREMSGEPSFLIAAHPTRGVDVGAQAAIWDHLRNARAAGLAVLLISADLDELIGLSDTIHVIYRGRLVAALDPSDVTPERLGGYMTGAIAGPEEA
ncbi:simple sugar transport system ATP-binding protein [Nonomuraea maritima]|uniref:Simple sugar transport system ATP-binding protein n=1 Tax=Nonomuraea maritima TaxID=683260 RepID=A0A1G9A558_9ACTN|nr:ABC transporter ATP-binding protein [Nonomuraea maritima]SDK22529.1 simple sugar transport system ATP-binding protein [Nonomuraea maritima]